MGRYDRQALIPGWQQDVVHDSHVFVVGAGTTGNEVIKNLALLGVGKITIADFDIIEEVNLSRSVLFRDGDIGKSKAETAALRAGEICSSLEVQGFDCDVVFDFGSARYREFDCVITTVDNLEARMWVNRYCQMNGVPMIDTGVTGSIGNAFITWGGNGPCLECSWMEGNYATLSKRYSCLKVGIESEDAKIPMVITSAAVVAGIAAHECVQLLHSRKRDGTVPNAGWFRWFNLDGATFLNWKHGKKAGCSGCHNEVGLCDARALHVQRAEKVADIKERLVRALEAEVIEIWADKEIVYTRVCGSCGERANSTPVPLGLFRRTLCGVCHQYDVVPDDYTAELRDGFTLLELGIPRSHYVRLLFSVGVDVREARLLVE